MNMEESFDVKLWRREIYSLLYALSQQIGDLQCLKYDCPDKWRNNSCYSLTLVDALNLQEKLNGILVAHSPLDEVV